VRENFRHLKFAKLALDIWEFLDRHNTSLDGLSLLLGIGKLMGKLK